MLEAMCIAAPLLGTMKAGQVPGHALL